MIKNNYPKNVKHLIVILCVALTPALVLAKNNNEYKLKLKQDSVAFNYKWEQQNGICKNDSNFYLKLQIDNNSNTKIIVSFEVLFFWKAQLHSTSNFKTYCIKPGKKIKGKHWNLVYKTKFYDTNIIKSNNFSWTISDVQIEKNSKCNGNLKLKLQPAYP